MRDRLKFGRNFSDRPIGDGAKPFPSVQNDISDQSCTHTFKFLNDVGSKCEASAQVHYHVQVYGCIKQKCPSPSEVLECCKVVNNSISPAKWFVLIISCLRPCSPAGYNFKMTRTKCKEKKNQFWALKIQYRLQFQDRRL